MGKRYQKGGGKEICERSQFFSLTGRRDCVFLSLPNVRKRKHLSFAQRAPPSGFRSPFRFTPGRTRRRNDVDDVFASKAPSNCHPVDRTESFPQVFSAIDLIFESFTKARKMYTMQNNVIINKKIIESLLYLANSVYVIIQNCMYTKE